MNTTKGGRGRGWNKGHIWSPEQRARISAGIRRYHEERRAKERAQVPVPSKRLSADVPGVVRDEVLSHIALAVEHLRCPVTVEVVNAIAALCVAVNHAKGGSH